MLQFIEKDGEQLLVKELLIAFTGILFDINLEMKEMRKTLEMIRREKVDKKIKKIEKGVEKSEKQLKSLAKMDKKRDKACEMGKKMMKKKK